MILNYNTADKYFYIRPQDMYRYDISPVMAAGMQWSDDLGVWFTADPYRALSLPTGTMPSPSAFEVTKPYISNRVTSQASRIEGLPNIPAPAAEEYLDFQEAGVAVLYDRFSAGHRAALLADPMGVGKTIQACGLINYCYFDPKRVLVISPASLRLNWQREMDKWILWSGKAFPVLHSSYADAYRSGSLLISYEMTLNDRLFDYLISQQWDLVIADEAHYLKNFEAERTKRVLAPGGIADHATHVLPMTGTPIPNWAHEFYPMLSSLAPDVIDGMTARQFSGRYTAGFMGDHGWQVTDGRNHAELGWRLRGSGFMVRRDKRAVLPQLPPERNQIIVLSQNKGTALVVRKEQDNAPFTAEEILRAGKPLGYGATPELRHEMGLEKVPDCLGWVKDQLDGGCEKIVLFGYHQDVLENMFEGLKKYNPVMVYGPTPMTTRQANVDRFQQDPNCRVIIGSWQPLGTGWTLTAAHACAFVEGSFVPKDNEQCKDRIVRIGTEAEHINVYYLVVEGSTEASVLAKAAMKLENTNRILK
jgi:SNF2 family DNA or RNA helicase